MSSNFHEITCFSWDPETIPILGHGNMKHKGGWTSNMTMWDALWTLFPLKLVKIERQQQPFKVSGTGLQGIWMKKISTQENLYRFCRENKGLCYFSGDHPLPPLSEQSRTPPSKEEEELKGGAGHQYFSSCHQLPIPEAKFWVGAVERWEIIFFKLLL